MSRNYILEVLKRLFLILCMVGVLACAGSIVFAKDSPGGGNGGSGAGSSGGRPKRDGSCKSVDKQEKESRERDTREKVNSEREKQDKVSSSFYNINRDTKFELRKARLY